MVPTGRRNPRPHDEVLLNHIQHPDWSSFRNTQVCAHSQPGALLLFVRGFQINKNLPYFRKVADFPPATSRQTSATVRSRYLPLHAQRKYQHGRRAKPPSVLLPLQPRLKSPLKRRCKRRLLKGVPKPWSEDPRGRLEGIPASRPGVTPRLGAFLQACWYPSFIIIQS